MKHRLAISDQESDAQFQRVSKDLLAHNARQGVNYWAGSEYPTMLLWAGRIYDFLRALEEVVGFHPARRHSYVVGYKSGWDGAQVSASLHRENGDAEGRVRTLLDGIEILAGAGWGRPAVEYDDEAGTVVWDFPEGTAVGIAARQDGVRNKPACPFLAGFVAGWTNRALGTQLEFEETECVGQGGHRCRFVSTEYLRPGAE